MVRSSGEFEAKRRDGRPGRGVGPRRSERGGGGLGVCLGVGADEGTELRARIGSRPPRRDGLCTGGSSRDSALGDRQADHGSLPRPDLATGGRMARGRRRLVDRVTELQESASVLDEIVIDALETLDDHEFRLTKAGI